MASRRDRVPARQQRSSQRDARQGRGADAARSQLRALRGLEQRLGVHGIVARQQQHGASFLRLGLSSRLGRQAVERFRARVQALRVRQRVQLEGQVAAGQGDAGARRRRRSS